MEKQGQKYNTYTMSFSKDCFLSTDLQKINRSNVNNTVSLETSVTLLSSMTSCAHDNFSFVVLMSLPGSVTWQANHTFIIHSNNVISNSYPSIQPNSTALKYRLHHTTTPVFITLKSQSWNDKKTIQEMRKFKLPACNMDWRKHGVNVPLQCPNCKQSWHIGIPEIRQLFADPQVQHCRRTFRKLEKIVIRCSISQEIKKTERCQNVLWAVVGSLVGCNWSLEN